MIGRDDTVASMEVHSWSHFSMSCFIILMHIIEMDLKEIGCKGPNWIHLAYDKSPLADSCEHDNLPLCSIFIDKLSNYQLFKYSVPWG
jgi:hypothetical protein